MNARINFQTIIGPDGQPAFVVVPYGEFQRLTAANPALASAITTDGTMTDTVPNAVVNAAFDQGISAIKAWREHLRLTQAEVAQRMGVSQAAYAQTEAAKRPRKVTLQKVADAMGVTLEQLNW